MKTYKILKTEDLYKAFVDMSKQGVVQCKIFIPDEREDEKFVGMGSVAEEFFMMFYNETRTENGLIFSLVSTKPQYQLASLERIIEVSEHLLDE